MEPEIHEMQPGGEAMELEWRFGVVGNIVREHQDENGETYYGTKEFVSGTKVYIDGKYWDYDCPEKTIDVIGLNRFHRYSLERVPLERIENVRFQLIRNTRMLSIIKREEDMEGFCYWGRTSQDKKEAKEFARNWENIKAQTMENSQR